MIPIKSAQDPLRLERFLEQDARNVQLLSDCAGAWLDQGNIEKAKQIASRIVDLNTSDAKALFTVSSVYMAGGMFSDAASILSSLHKQDKDNFGIAYNLSYCLTMQSQFIEALEILSELSPSLYSNDHHLCLLHGTALHFCGRADEALEVIGRYSGAPSSELHGLAALLSFDMQNYEESRKHATLSLSLDSDTISARITQGFLLLQSNEPGQAGPIFLKVLECHPLERRALTGAALSFMTKADAGRATEYLVKALDLDGADIALLNALAWCHLISESVKNAKETWQKALDIDRNFAELHGGMAVAFICDGDKANAEKSIKRALKLDPDCYSARFARIFLLNLEASPETANLLLSDMLDTALPNSEITLRSAIQRHFVGQK